jgi:ribose-phosphate pyrophosphokinase
MGMGHIGEVHMDKRVIWMAPEASRSFAQPLMEQVGASLAELEEKSFADGEFTLRPVTAVHDSSVVLIQSLSRDQKKSVADKLCELLLLASTVRNAGARKLILLAPYLCLSRSDRPMAFQGPVFSRSVAELIEACGFHQIITMDVHNPSSYHSAFRCPAANLSAMEIFARHVHEQWGLVRPAVVSPDLGGIKRCENFRAALRELTGFDPEFCIASKERSDHVVADRIVSGSVSGKDAILVDDMISTGSTLAHAIQACMNQGARRIYVAATHGLFAAEAESLLGNLPIEKILLANTVVPYHLESPGLRERVEILNTAPVFAHYLKERLA